LRISSSTRRRGPGDLERFPKDKKRVSGLTLEIRSRVNNIKRTKKTQSEDLEILRNCKAPIRTPPVYYIWKLWQYAAFTQTVTKNKNRGIPKV